MEQLEDWKNGSEDEKEGPKAGKKGKDSELENFKNR